MARGFDSFQKWRNMAISAYNCVQNGINCVDSGIGIIDKCKREVPEYVGYDALASNTVNNLTVFSESLKSLSGATKELNSGGSKGTRYYREATNNDRMEYNAYLATTISEESNN